MARRAPEGRLRPHYVYRCYDSADRLLYVGCSSCPPLRLEGHRLNAWWWPDVATVRNLVFPDRDTALAKERRAIYEEKPRCNVRGRWYRRDPRDDWKVEDYAEFHEAILKTANGVVDTPNTSRLLNEVRAEAHARFGVALFCGRAA